MKRKILLFFLLSIAFSQLSIAYCQLSVTRERVFTGSGLYGFMNGGADLFMEYGVTELVTRDIEYEGEKYTVDIYEMPTPEDAFGIYSMHIFRCQRADTLDCIDCLSPYQLQAVVDNKYISVVFPSGSARAQKIADEVIRTYLSEKSKSSPSFPSGLAGDLPYSGVIKYLRGPLSASSASKDLSILLKDILYSGIWFRGERGEDTYKAYILLSNAAEAIKLKDRIPATDIIEEGTGFLYVKGEEKEEDTPDYGPFGF